jgi:hypothetical protein
VRHGTLTAYTHDGCRCDDCRRARAHYKRKWVARNAERYNAERAAQDRLARAARNWLAEHHPEVLEHLKKEVAA